MKKIIENSNIKKIVVKCAKFWIDEFEVDANIFDDVYLEAATRAVEKRKNLPGFKITIFLECWEKKDFAKFENHYCYNTYYVLINAGLHEKAEIFRKNCIKVNSVDLQKESLKANDGINNDTTVG